MDLTNVRLQVGHLSGEATEKDGIYEKPVMMVYAGKFKSMDGDVEIKDEDIDKLASNHNGFLGKLKRLATGDVAIHHNPPLQLDHSTSAHDTVGRLVGDLTVGEHEDEDGKKKKALMGRVRVLGADNIEKVKDGRWAQVSIGADLQNHKISELSITPFPAAEHASLLKRARLHKKLDYLEHWIKVYENTVDGKWSWEIENKGGAGEESEAAAVAAAKAAIDEHHKMNPGLSGKSQGVKMSYKETKEKADLYGKCRKHLTEHKKMSEEDADKHLEAAKDEELKHMSEEHDKHMKHLAEEDEKKKKEEEEKKAKMAGSRDGVLKLAKGFRVAGQKAQLAQKGANIQVRLAKLRGDAKVSPAEMKTIDIDALAAKSDEAIEAVLSSYEKRQPVIDTGILGSTKAMTPAQLQASLKKSNIEVDTMRTRLAMPSKRDAALEELKAAGLSEHNFDKAVKLAKDNDGDDDGEKHLSDDEAHEKYKKMMDEGKHDEAKEHLKSYMKTARAKHLAEANPSADAGPRMSALADQVKSMQNDFEALVQLAAPALGLSAEELK